MTSHLSFKNLEHRAELLKLIYSPLLEIVKLTGRLRRFTERPPAHLRNPVAALTLCERAPDPREQIRLLHFQHMDSDIAFSHFIEPAKEIRAGGRWAAVNKRLIALCANPGVGNAWWVQVVGAICEHTFSGYLALCAAYEQSSDDSPLLAWRARNLLELSVWAVYCSKSRENARVLYADAGQDLINLIKVFQDWGTAHMQGDVGNEWTQRFADAEKVLSEKAAAEGISVLDGSFKAVSKAAKEADFGKHFAISYKMLSKYAHPTAMLMLAPPKSATPTHAEMFYGLGSLYFTGAFTALEKLLLPAPDLG